MMMIVGVLIGIHVLDNMIGKHMSKNDDVTSVQTNHECHDHFREDLLLNKDESDRLCVEMKGLSDTYKFETVQRLDGVIMNNLLEKKKKKDKLDATTKSNSVIADVLNKAD